MKKEDLIAALEKLPNGIEVCILDWKRNVKEDWGDGSGAGIYKSFEVEEVGADERTEDSIPFAVLSFDNEYIEDNEI